MIDEKELKDSVKECVDIAMEQNDEAKREIFAGLFEEVDRLINETITIQAINDDEKKKWFDNEMIKTYEQEIKELQDENRMQDHELERLRAELKLEEDNRKYLNEQIERLHSIIKEVRGELLKYENDANRYVPIIECLEILDKENN